MKAARYLERGPARNVLEVVEVPTPRPSSGEVLVRIHASGVNPSDVKSRGGGIGRKQDFEYIIPHSDGAGVIEAVGEGVPDSRIGERVWIWNGQWKRPHGTAAEYIALPTNQAVPLPDEISFTEAACFGIPLLTAVQAMSLCNAKAGDWVLISGGAGAVSQYAIQVAKYRELKVICTVSGEEKAAVAMEVGADVCVNYKTSDVASCVSETTNGKGVASVIELDLTQNAVIIPEILEPHGTVVAYGMSDNTPTIPGRWMLQNNVDLRLFLVYELSLSDRAKGLALVSEMIEKSALQHRIHSELPLDEIVTAHELVEGAPIGNVVVRIPT